MLNHAENMQARFLEIYNRYKDEMYQYAYQILRNDADAQDAVQNALLRILERTDRVSKDAREARSYVLKIVRCTAIDIYRRNRQGLKLRSSISTEISIMGQRCGVDPSHYVLATEKTSNLLQYLEKLSGDYGELIKLRYIDGLSSKEIAVTLDIREGTVNTKLCRARRALEKELRQDGLLSEDDASCWIQAHS